MKTQAFATLLAVLPENDALQSFLNGFFNKVIEYITEPDKITYKGNKLIEYYGKRKVIYTIKDDDDNFEVIREA